MTYKPFSRYFPSGISPYSRVQPFTYRDGRTFIESLEDIIRYVREYLIPAIDERVGVLTEEVHTALDNLEAAIELAEEHADRAQRISDEMQSILNPIIAIRDEINALYATIQTDYGEFEDFVEDSELNINTIIANAQDTFNSLVEYIEGVAGNVDAQLVSAEQILADIEAVASGVSEDSVVANIFRDEDSETRTLVDELYALDRSEVRDMVTHHGIHYSEDYGLTGGRDESDALRAFLLLPGVHVFEPGKDYWFSEYINFGQDSEFRFNGSTLRCIEQSGGGNLFTIYGNTRIDNLTIRTVGGNTARGGHIEGTQTVIDHVSLTADSVTGTGNHRIRALKITNAEDVRINRYTQRNYLYGVSVESCSRVTIQNLDIGTAAQGVFIEQSSDVRIEKGVFHTPNSQALGNPGENAVLTGDRVRGVHITDFDTHGTPEHGFRMGGQLGSSDVYFTNCTARHPGLGSAQHGGCGFKILGANTLSNAESNYHRNIHFVNCSAIDMEQYGNNAEGLLIGKALGVHVTNFYVGTHDNSTSCDGAIRVFGSREVHLANITASGVRSYGLRLEQTGNANDGGETARVNVNGFTQTSGDSFMSVMNAVGYTRQFTCEGVMLQGVGSLLVASNASNILQGKISGTARAYTSGLMTNGSNVVVDLHVDLFRGDLPAAETGSRVYGNGAMRTYTGTGWE